MTHYLLAVHGPAEMEEFGNYGSKEEMEAAFAATDSFNDKLPQKRVLSRAFVHRVADGTGCAAVPA